MQLAYVSVLAHAFARSTMHCKGLYTVTLAVDGEALVVNYGAQAPYSVGRPLIALQGLFWGL
jgi:hypothetical protein